MVMTTNKSPRLSVFGSAAALVAASIGAVIAPALACPPECEEAAVVESGSFGFAPEGFEEPDMTTFERFMGGAHDDRASALIEQFREMESRMRTLEAMIYEYTAGAAAPAARGVRGTVAGSGEPRWDIVQVAPDDGMGLALFGDHGATAGGEEFERDYYIPKGRLQGLVELMSRSDVPTLIRDGDDHITVIGTAQEHAVFSAFVKMICPEGVEVTDDNGNSVQWRTAPMTPSAPALLRYQQDAERTRAIGGAYERAALEELMAKRAALRTQQRSITQKQRQLERQAAQAERMLDQSLDQIDGVSEDSDRARELERKAEEYRGVMEALESQADSMDSDSDRLEDAIDSLEDQIEALKELIKEQAEANAGESVFGSRAVGFGR